ESFAAGSSCAAGGVGGAKASARSPAAAASTTRAIRTDRGERGRIVGRLVERSGGAGVLAPDRFEAGVAAAAGAVGVVAVGVRAVEILVDLLGGVEPVERRDLRRYLLVKAGLERCERGAGYPLLLVVPVVDPGAVLRAAVAELVVHGERVDVVPEDLDERLVAHRLRIVDDTDDLGVVGAAVGDVVLGRVRRGAAGEAGDDGEHAVELFVRWLHAPEAAAGEDRRVRLGGRLGVEAGGLGRGRLGGRLRVGAADGEDDKRER